MIPGLLAWLSLAAVPPAWLRAADPGQPRLDRTVFTARGANQTILHLAAAGRYSLQVKSGQGTRIEVVDRMAGTIGGAGEAGQSDGRLDLVLDRGDYKVRLLSHPQGGGEARLQVFPFRAVQPVADPADHPRLKDLELVSASLGDLQQQNYWIELSQRQVLNLEVQGRALAECRLWKDGVLWEDLTPSADLYEPEPGRPMYHLEFHHELGPGLYLLACYGGPLRKWSGDDPRSPLYLRLGIPEIGENGQRLLTLSPFGRDVFLCGSETRFFQLVRAEKKPARLLVRVWDRKSPRFGPGSSAQIGKESRDPWCSLKTSPSGSDLQLVAVSAKPGDALELDYFRQTHFMEIRDRHDRHWISSIHSAEGRDALDVTALLFNVQQKTALREQLPRVGGQSPLVRRVNLLDTDSLFFFVQDQGTYVIDEEKSAGGAAEYQIAPFLTSRPENYLEPGFQPAGEGWDLVPGYYVLTLRPKSKGILHFALHQKSGIIASLWNSLVRRGSDPSLDRPEAAVRGFIWPEVTFDRATWYTLSLNQRSGVESGILLRSLPIDLREPLPFTLAPGGGVTVPVRLAEAGTVAVIGGAGELIRDGTPLAAGTVLPAGDYTLEVKNRGPAAGVFNLVTLPSPPPSTRPAVRRIEETLPMLREGQTVFADYDREQTREFLVRVAEPAFYRIETTGLLATAIRVRSLLVASLFSETENGVGRNALVQQYLKPGDYVVAVQTCGSTRGRCGLQLRKTRMVAAGDLTLDNVGRTALPADTALRYRFRIESPGRYRLQTLGLDSVFSYRLEEEGGWPLVLNDSAEAIEREFVPGSYQYYSLPTPVASRRVSCLRPLEEERPTRGKGPHPLVPNRAVENVWMEAPDRQPDLYELRLTAPAPVELSIDRDLQATIVDPRGEARASTVNGRWSGDLEAGTWRVQVVSIEKTNRLPYSLALTTAVLMPGLQKEISGLPCRIEVSLGESGLAELSSFGRQDCRAVLREKGSGAIVAANDDAPADWNFNITRELKAGRYLLEVESMSPQTQPFRVAMVSRPERDLAERTVPFAAGETIGREMLKLPLLTPPEPRLLRFAASGPTAVRLALMAGDRLIATGLGEIRIPLPGDRRYNLLAWLEGNGSGTVQVRADLTEASPLALGEETTLDGFRAARLQLPAGGGLLASAATGVIRYSPQLESPCLPPGEPGETVWLGSGWLELTPPGRLQISPFVLKADAERSLRLGDRPLDFRLDSGAAPLLVECESAGSWLGIDLFDAAGAGKPGHPETAAWQRESLTLTGVKENESLPGRLRRYRPAETTADAGDRPAEPVTLRTRAFPDQPLAPVSGHGRLEVQLEPGRSLRIPVARGTTRFELVLSRGLAAFAWSDGRATAVVAADDDNLHEEMTVGPGTLYVVNRGSEAAPLCVTASPAGPIEPGAPAGPDREEVCASAGTRRQPLPPAPPGHILCLAGDDVDGRLLTDDGRLDDGRPLDGAESIRCFSGSGGVLLVRHGPGLVKTWTAPPEMARALLLGDLRAAVQGAWRDGNGRLENRIQSWPVEIDQPRLVSASLSGAGAIALLRDGRPLALAASADPAANRIFAILERGGYTICTRPLSGHFQEGTVGLATAPIQALPLSDPERDRLIDGGELQAFRFTVKAKAKVGVGIKCESDRLDAWLLDSAMKPLGRGPLQIRELETGDYYLVVLAGSVPVRFRPLLVGHEGSLQPVPDDVLREYLNEGGNDVP